MCPVAAGFSRGPQGLALLPGPSSAAQTPLRAKTRHPQLRTPAGSWQKPVQPRARAQVSRAALLNSLLLLLASGKPRRPETGSRLCQRTLPAGWSHSSKASGGVFPGEPGTVWQLSTKPGPGRKGRWKRFPKATQGLCPTRY